MPIQERLQTLWSQYRERLLWNNENRSDHKKYEAYWAGQAEQKLKELVDLAKSFRGLSFRVRISTFDRPCRNISDSLYTPCATDPTTQWT